MILTHRQDGGGGVWATHGPPGGIVEVHPSPWLQGGPRFTWRTEGVGMTPLTDFSKFPKALFQ